MKRQICLQAMHTCTHINPEQFQNANDMMINKHTHQLNTALKITSIGMNMSLKLM